MRYGSRCLSSKGQPVVTGLVLLLLAARAVRGIAENKQCDRKPSNMLFCNFGIAARAGRRIAETSDAIASRARCSFRFPARKRCLSSKGFGEHF